jgi:hypothetical protein
LRNRHLVDLFGLLGAGHVGSPSRREGACHAWDH